MGNWRVRGGGFQASWKRFLGHELWLQFHDATRPIKRNISDDRATIAQRSCHDRVVIRSGLHGDRTRNEWRSSLDPKASTKVASDAAIDDDRVRIARWSGYNRASIVVLHEKRQPFDEEWVGRPMTWCRSPFDGDRTTLVMPRVTRYALWSLYLGENFSTCLIWWSRGLGSTGSPPFRPNPTLLAPPRVLQNRNRVGT